MGKIVTIDTESLNVNWQPNRQYRLSLDQGFVIEDGNNRSPNPANTNLSTFTTNATGPSISSSTPSDGDTNAISNAVISIVFNRRIKAGTGNIRLYDSSNNVLKTWTPSSGTDVTFTDQTLSLSFTGLVIEGGSYYLQADSGSITDRDGFDYAGISNTTDYNWTNSTGPEFPSLAANLSGAFLPTMSVNAQRVGDALLSINSTLAITAGKLHSTAISSITAQATTTTTPIAQFVTGATLSSTATQTALGGNLQQGEATLSSRFLLANENWAFIGELPENQLDTNNTLTYSRLTAVNSHARLAIINEGMNHNSEWRIWDLETGENAYVPSTVPTKSYGDYPHSVNMNRHYGAITIYSLNSTLILFRLSNFGLKTQTFSQSVAFGGSNPTAYGTAPSIDSTGISAIEDVANETDDFRILMLDKMFKAKSYEATVGDGYYHLYLDPNVDVDMTDTGYTNTSAGASFTNDRFVFMQNLDSDGTTADQSSNRVVVKNADGNTVTTITSQTDGNIISVTASDSFFCVYSTASVDVYNYSSSTKLRTITPSSGTIGSFSSGPTNTDDRVYMWVQETFPNYEDSMVQVYDINTGNFMNNLQTKVLGTPTNFNAGAKPHPTADDQYAVVAAPYYIESGSQRKGTAFLWKRIA